MPQDAGREYFVNINTQKILALKDSVRGDASAVDYFTKRVVPLVKKMQAQSAKDGAGGAGVDMIVPMPSSGDGLKMLVERVAKETGLGYQTDVLQETGVKTREQKKVYSAKARLWNVHGAFEVKNPGGIEGKNILLIDDVMTTGSTVAEVRKILVDAGANSVEVLVRDACRRPKQDRESGD